VKMNTNINTVPNTVGDGTPTLRSYMPSRFFKFRTVWGGSRTAPDCYYLITMLIAFVTFPAEFVAFIVKLDVPDVVGVPVIAPVVAFIIKPTGRVPLSTAHVIGVVPVALSF